MSTVDGGAARAMVQVGGAGVDSARVTPVAATALAVEHIMIPAVTAQNAAREWHGMCFSGLDGIHPLLLGEGVLLQQALGGVIGLLINDGRMAVADEDSAGELSGSGKSVCSSASWMAF